MNRLMIVSMCLASGLALADGTDEAQTARPIEGVEIRLATFEQIDVTAEKKPIDANAATDAEIDAILEETEALETESEEN